MRKLWDARLVGWMARGSAPGERTKYSRRDFGLQAVVVMAVVALTLSAVSTTEFLAVIGAVAIVALVRMRRKH